MYDGALIELKMRKVLYLMRVFDLGGLGNDEVVIWGCGGGRGREMDESGDYCLQFKRDDSQTKQTSAPLSPLSPCFSQSISSEETISLSLYLA